MRWLHGGPRGRYRRGCGVSTGAKAGSGCARSDTPVMQPITTRFGSPRIATMTSQPRPQAPSHASKRAMAGWKSSPWRPANALKTASMFGATVYSGDSGGGGAGTASTAGGQPGASAAARGALADARRPAGTAGGGMAVAGVAREPAVLAIEPRPCYPRRGHGRRREIRASSWRSASCFPRRATRPARPSPARTCAGDGDGARGSGRDDRNSSRSEATPPLLRFRGRGRTRGVPQPARCGHTPLPGHAPTRPKAGRAQPPPSGTKPAPRPDELRAAVVLATAAPEPTREETPTPA